MEHLAALRCLAMRCALATAAVALLASGGHALGLRTLAALGAGEPIRIGAALGLLAGAAGVAALITGRERLARGAAFALLLIALGIVGRIQLADGWFWPAPATGVALALVAASLLAFGARRIRVAEACAVAAGVLALFAMMRTLLGVTGDGGLVALTWITFPAALGLLLLTAALLLAEPRTTMVRLLASSRLEGEMARWMLPAAILVPTALAALHLLGHDRGWFGVDFGLALMMTVLICLLVGVLFGNASRLRALTLAEEEERALLDDAQTLARLGSWVLDRRSTRVDYSPQCAALFGLAPQRLQPGLAGLLTLVCDRDRVAFASGLDALSAANPLLQTEVRMCHVDGGERSVLVRARAEIDEDGAVERVLGTLLDLTELRRNEHALAEREQRLATLLQSIGDAVIATDANGRVEHMNPVAERMTGWNIDEARGRPLAEVFHIINERTRMPVENPVGRVLREGRVVGLANHTALVRRDGDERSIADSAAPVRDRDGNVTGVVMVFHDVTDVRVAQEEQERLRARLVAADRMASLGLLAAGVAHEINNPLSYVIGGLSVLEPSLFDRIHDAARGSAAENALAPLISEGRELAHDCQQGAERVRRIVGDLSAFGRNHDDDHSGANVHEAIELALRMAGNQIRPRARIETALAAVPPVAIGQARLGQVVLNLLVNAAHAIPEGVPERNLVRVACRTEPDGRRVVIEIQDTGCGIAPENVARLFDPFFTTKPVGVGTGLGLSICHGIVTAAGGDITVDSDPGKGSTFRLLLPVAQRAPNGVVIEPKPALPPVRRGRILIIDDDPLVGKIIARVLQPDHDAVIATDSRAALERLLGGEHFDAVLCDLMMPGLSGMDVHQRLSAIRPTMLARFIFMTGGAVNAAAQDFVRNVAERCIGKPVDKRVLQDMLREVIGGVAEH